MPEREQLQVLPVARDELVPVQDAGLLEGRALLVLIDEHDVDGALDVLLRRRLKNQRNLVHLRVPVQLLRWELRLEADGAPGERKFG